MRPLAVILGLLFATHAHAQNAAPARLAILSENQSQSGAIAADVLTTQLSSNPQLHLLERDEIARVYREQALSKGNKDYLQTGKVLGADGLLLVNAVEKVRESTNITVRFVAIKPGVILADEVYGWPGAEAENWSRLVAKRVAPLVPKLTVLPKDAVPISVVGFHSPNKSVEAQDTELQLQLLTIERFTREPQVFALERRKMQALVEEKDLKGDGSSFWSGAYLFEAAIDQAGYSPETITVNASLTPASGGTPLQIELSGSRTNLPAIVNDLVSRAIEMLKVKPTAKPWNAADEAAQYFDEAGWQLKWKSFGPAQEAAESAWAMGKQDVACGVLRVSSAVGLVSSHLTRFENLEASEPVSFRFKPNPGKNDEGSLPVGTVYETEEHGGTRTIRYVTVYSAPERENIERAARMLGVYEELSKRFSPSVMTVASVKSGWKNSDWYNAGVDGVAAASEVLENFHLVPRLAEKEADGLADLRAHVRAVAEWIENAPAVHASYYITNQIANHDALANLFDSAKNIFSCTLTNGAFWSENPDATIATYRRLMSTPVYAYIHQDLWFRELQQPRLVTWPSNDTAQLSAIWKGFVRELDSSTNLLWRLEAKAFALADAPSEAETGVAFTNLFTALIDNGPTLAANPVEVLYMDWWTGALMRRFETGMVTPFGEALAHVYHSRYETQLGAFDREYWDKTIPAFAAANKPAPVFLASTVFEEQKNYLKENRPFTIREFAKVFGDHNYSKEQAEELLPLIRSYRASLLESMKGKGGQDRAQLQIGNFNLDTLESQVTKILKPSAGPTVAQNTPQHPITMARPPQSPYSHAFIPEQRPAIMRSNSARTEAEVITNVFTVTKFLPIPLELLANYATNSACILAHQWIDNKLVLDFQYSAWVATVDGNGKTNGSRNIKPNGVAILDPDSERWRVAPYPVNSADSNNRFELHNYYSTTLFNGDIYLSFDGKFWVCDKGNQWHALPISDGNNYQLFNVNGHLYATDRTIIFEVTDGGKSTKLLASSRRRPAKTALDSLEFDVAPVLFPGPGNSLRTSVAGHLFSWAGANWTSVGQLPMTRAAEIQPEGVLFRGAGRDYHMIESYVLNSSSTPEVLFDNGGAMRTYGALRLQQQQREAETVSGGVWQTSENISSVPQATRGSDLYMLLNHSTVQNVVSNHVILRRKIVPEGGCHAKLLHFVRGQAQSKPQFLLFDAKDACPPVGAERGAFTPGVQSGEWILFASKWLLFGSENPIGVPTGTARMTCPPGVWVCPASSVE